MGWDLVDGVVENRQWVKASESPEGRVADGEDQVGKEDQGG